MRSLWLQVAAVTSINLKSIAQRRWLSLSTVIAIVDGVQGPDTLRIYPEAQRQLALADAVFVSKRDILDHVNPELDAAITPSRIWRSFSDVPEQLFDVPEVPTLAFSKPIIGHHGSRFAACCRRIAREESPGCLVVGEEIEAEGLTRHRQRRRQPEGERQDRDDRECGSRQSTER